ncbi:galactose metabolism-related protein [Vermiconidia calcicola]|uniref:Galactose metabolism-related protein n=1 Tax=Vermiconidia calcicola TaxID=1690605 RepID=A0ACC3NIZ6_9PEZI|nr:galactose metabolism-related protein [Vermiconidia calcicola]
MGNSQSNDAPKSPSASSQTPSRKDRGRNASQSRERPNGGQAHVSSATRKSHSHVSKSQTPPIPSLVPSSSTASTSTSNAHAHATGSSPASSQHSRARSITASATPTPHLDDSGSSRKSSPMGNTESRHRPPSRSTTLPAPASEKPQPSPLPQPVDVPQPAHQEGFDGQDVVEPPVNTPSYGLAASDFSNPPRLPLPIERDPEPASPIATPQDANTPVDATGEGELRRRGSMLSSTTLDDDEAADIETFAHEADSGPKVLTTLNWRGDAKAVYVTGTFAQWEKKFRMQKTQDTDGSLMFTLTAQLPTGTHHIKFLVDGEMLLSDQYPTTVDYTNSLVNYFEIASFMPPADAQPPAPAEPIAIPGTAVSDHAQEGRTHPLSIRSEARAPETPGELPSTLQETVVPAPTDPENVPQESEVPVQQPQQQWQREHQSRQPRPPKQPRPPQAKYTNEIPELLLHLDLYSTPDDERYRRASKAIQHLPQPPSLPMFMSKSILNANTPHKDDASVLTMPNHTVLNHLATSSIRNGVLATSGTTRYKRKFLTTIMYKPTSEDG